MNDQLNFITPTYRMQQMAKDEVNAYRNTRGSAAVKDSNPFLYRTAILLRQPPAGRAHRIAYDALPE
jgi:hypothetical protein